VSQPAEETVCADNLVPLDCRTVTSAEPELGVGALDARLRLFLGLFRELATDAAVHPSGSLVEESGRRRMFGSSKVSGGQFITQFH